MPNIVWTGCPSLGEIRRFVRGQLKEPDRSDVEAHLEETGCEECALAAEQMEAETEERVAPAGEMPEQLRQTVRRMLASRRPSPTPPETEAPAIEPHSARPGQVWSTHGVLEVGGTRYITRCPPLVVVLQAGEPSAGEAANADAIRVAPLSDRVRRAAAYDLLVGLDGLPVMVEAWNHTSALRAHLRACVGELAPAAMEALRAVVRAADAGQAVPPEVAARCGAPITDPEDERLDFQREESDNCSHFWKPALAALPADAL